MAQKIESSDSEDTPLQRTASTTRVNGAGNTKQKVKRRLSTSGAEETANGAPPPKRKRKGPHLSPESEPAPKLKGSRGLSSRKRKVAKVSSSDDEPLASPAKQISTTVIVRPPNGDAVSSDVPLAADLPEVATMVSLSMPKANSDSSDSGDDDNLPLSIRAKNKKTVIKEESSDSSDTPLSKKVGKTKAKRVTKKRAKKESDDEGDEEEDVKPKKRRAKGKKVKKETDEEGSKPSTSMIPQTPTSKPAKKKAKKEEPGSPLKSPTKKGKEEEEEEDMFRWWEQQALGDGSKKWSTLEHHGVLFPPPYEPLPPNVKLVYDGKEVDLPPESEEVAGFFGAMLDTDHTKDATFQKNFFHDFLEILKHHPPRNQVNITEFDKCDFSNIFQWYEEERAKKKALPATRKKELKAEKDLMEEKYVYCLLDGRKEKVGNFKAEPPGLFRGRGDHPKKGALKNRLYPGDITLNIGKGVPIPTPNIPGNWGKVIHDDTVTWLANWKENINGNSKYVFLAAGSSLKGQSDMQKFEKARELKKHVHAIREEYTKNLTSKVMVDRQLATALYLIDRLALRAGNEKGEDEADTVGCCSLRYEHVTLEPPDQLCFDFLGKDSIRYLNTVCVDAQVYKNIRLFKKEPKTVGDAIFDRVTTTAINKHLTSYMKGLTAKVFRTYNASITFQEQLESRTPKNASVIEKITAYNEANRQVAILCNHQKTVSKTHGASMEKLSNQIRAIKYQRRKHRYALLAMNKAHKKNPQYAEDESDIDDEWIAEYEDESREKEIEKATKKWEKDNEKAKADEEKPVEKDVLQGKIDKINDEYDRLKTERGTKTAEVKGNKTDEQIMATIEKLDERIKIAKFKRLDKDNLKEVSLGTSKINYLDPRITVAWCRAHEVPVEKLFSKTLVTKFPWAMEVEPDWKF